MGWLAIFFSEEQQYLSNRIFSDYSAVCTKLNKSLTNVIIYKTKPNTTQQNTAPSVGFK